MKAKLILNPKAGNNLGIHYLPIIKKKFKDWKLEIYKTKSSKDATREAKKSRKYDVVIVAGGDGTINEVINGLANSRVKFGIIPIGTGNVFARELRLPINIYKICNIIKRCKIKRYDLGKANRTYFLLSCGIGFDATVLNEMDPLIKKFLGVFSYHFYAFKKIRDYKAPLITVTVKNIKKKGNLLIISNTKNYAGNFKFSPKANPFDGKLDICLFEDKIEFFKLLNNMLKVKLNIKPRNLWHYQTKEMKVTSNPKNLIHTDGEVIGTTPLNIKVVPRAISIIVP